MRVIDHFDSAVLRAPTRLAVSDGTCDLTFQDVADLSVTCAEHLLSHGFVPGTRAAVWMGNNAIAVPWILGIMRAQGVWISLDPRAAPAANADLLRRAGAQYVIYEPELREAVMTARGETPDVPHYLCWERNGGPTMVESGHRPVTGSSLVSSLPEGPSNTAVAVQQTGGTTGAPKLIEMTTEGFLAIIETSKSLASIETGAQPVKLCIGPVTYRDWMESFFVLTAGGTVVLMRGAFNPVAVIDLIERYDVTHMTVAPTVITAMLTHRDAVRSKCRSLRRVLVAMAAMPPHVMLDALEVFGTCICHLYGQQEVGAIAVLDGATMAAAARGIEPARLLSCGRTIHGMDIAVMSDDGELLPHGEIGEVVVKGPTVQANLDGKSLQGIWHRTGDIGRVDSEGYLYLLDRKLDVIVTSGYKVYSTEVEAAIATINEVSECAVIGVPNDVFGESLVAVVVNKEGCHVTSRGVINHCKQYLGRAKAPVKVLFREGLPRTVLGKVDKATLRAEAQSPMP